jgi:GAF domain-containing protein
MRAMKAPIPENEARRLVALRRYQVLDTMAEQSFDEIVKVAAYIFGTPIALISLVDEERQWFKAKVGLEPQETHRDLAFCAYTMQQNEVLTVADATKDSRFADNALVTGDPSIRFYAGAPLVTPDGFGLGSLCVIDRQPKVLDAAQKEILQSLSRMVMTTLELRRVSNQLVEEIERVKTLAGMLPICCGCKNIRNDKGYWERVERYVQDRSEANFTHTYCPDCAKKYFPDLTSEEIFGGQK